MASKSYGPNLKLGGLIAVYDIDYGLRGSGNQLGEGYEYGVGSGLSNGTLVGPGGGLGNGGGDGYGEGGVNMSWSNVKGDLLKEDIEQSHHFTITLDKISQFIPEYYRTRFQDSQKFLPVKSISFTHASLESMNIPLGVVGNLPILQRTSLGKLTMTFYDNDREPIERAIRYWIDFCFPYNRYVSYLSDIVGTLEYTSYGVTGRRNKEVSGKYYVIPAENFTVDRSYDANDAKLMNFSVVIIGKDNWLT